MNHEIAKFIVEKWELLAAIGAIGGASGLAGAVYRWRQNRHKAQRLRYIPRGDFPFEVIPPRSIDLLPRIMGSEGDDPLADHNIPYQERQSEQQVGETLKAVLQDATRCQAIAENGQRRMGQPVAAQRIAAHLIQQITRGS